jgi:hypothetical protein
MENVRIREAVELMYGPSLQQWAGTKDLDPTALFLGLSFGVLIVNHPQGAWSSFCRNTIGQQSSPALRPEGVSDDQAQPPDLDPDRYTTECPSRQTNYKLPQTL